MSHNLLNTLEYLMNNVITAVYCMFMFSILRKFFKERFPHKAVTVFAFLCLMHLSNPVIYPGEMTGTVGILVGWILYILLFFKGSLIERLSVAIVIYPMIISINSLTENLGFQIWQDNQEMPLSAQAFLHSMTLLLRVPAWWGVWLIARKRIHKARELTTHTWIIIDTLCIASSASLIVLLYHTSLRTAYILYPACITGFLTGIGCIYLSYYIVRITKTDLLVQNMKYQQAYYEEMEQNQQNTRKLRHDMKNHLNVLASCIQNQDFETASHYLDELSSEFTVNNRTFCKNSIVNAVVNSKYNLAVKENIDCFINISIDGLMGMDDVSLCSLFANTLDNAVDACRQIPDESKRRISVKARYEKGYFSYEISNSKANSIHTSQTRFLTQKKNKEMHGFGLQNVRDIVEKYSGSMDVTYTEESFTVTVLIGSL